MHAWEQIQQTIEYIEDHIAEEVDIPFLAQLAALSPFYYQRLFSRLVKKPVAEYTKLRRMAKATELLLQKDRRILDVAIELGFSSHEQFSRSFKDTFGITPNEYRKQPLAMNYMTKPELMLHYTLVDEGVPLIANGIVLEINRRHLAEPGSFIGLEAEMPVSLVDGLGTESGEDQLYDLWQSFHIQKEAVLGLTDEQEEIGVSHPSMQEGTFLYFAGAENPSGKAREGYAHWEMPPGDYIVCSFEAEHFNALVMDALYKAQQYLYNTWLPKHQLRTEPFCAERYASHSPDTSRMEIWLKLMSAH